MKMNLFSSTIESPSQQGQTPTVFTLSESVGKAKQFTISQLHFDGTQSPPLYAVKVSHSLIEVFRLSSPKWQPPQGQNSIPVYLPQQQQMTYSLPPPYPVLGISNPDVHMPVPMQPFPCTNSSSKTSSLLSSLSSRTESYLNKSPSASSILNSLSGMREQGSQSLALNTGTIIATINFHSFSSKIDVSLHPAHRTFTISKPDFFSSGYHFEMLLPLEFSNPCHQHSQRQLTSVKWKKEDDILSGGSSGLRLDTVERRQTIARYHKTLKLRGGKSSVIEVFLAREQLSNLEVLDTVIVTAVALAKYRADSDKAEIEAANEVVSAFVGG